MKSIFTSFFLGLALLLSCFEGVFAQGEPSSQLPTVTLSDQVTMKIGGFARGDIFFDTHKNTEILDGLLDLYPTNKKADAYGEDIDQVNQFRMSAAASRLNTRFTGPDAFGAKSSAFIEFDFTGYNGIGLRLRHAWMKLNWQNSELLAGRYWHPMFIVDAFPTVLALNTGAPFLVFNRCEQIRYTFKINTLSLMAAASAQMDYGFPATHNQVIPDLTGNIQYSIGDVMLGVSANYKVNRPNLFVTKNGIKYQTNEKVSSIAEEFYMQVKTGLLKVKGSALYGENMHELLMLSGYAVKSKDTATNIETYSTLNTLNYWLNIVYGDQLQWSLFLGYVQNLGATETKLVNSSPLVGRGADIDNLIRISPSVSYKMGRVQFWLELQHTIAAYGTNYTSSAKNEFNENAKVTNTENISNTRLQFATIFYF